MTTRTWLSATLAVCIIAIAPSSSAEDFSIDLTRIYYQDGSGREIDYDFSTGSVDGEGAIAIPPAAILQRPMEEAGTAYALAPVFGNVSCALGGGAATMSIPQADITIPPIPSATIAADGDPADWAAVGPYVQDTNTLEDDVSQPGTDVEYVKLAYSPDGTRLNILIKVTDAISQQLWYRMFFTRDTDDIDRPGNYQVDFYYWDGAWRVGSQGWDPEGEWYPIDEDGLAAASGAFIEGSFDVAALGLGSEFFFLGRTMQSEAPYAHYDYFGVSGFEQEGLYGLGPNPGDPTAAATGDCTFEATITNFQNVSREQYYFDVGVGLGSWDPGPQPELWATWFTGMHEGTLYENVLVLGAGVYDESTGEEWESAEIVLEELNPSTATLDLKVEITGGTTFSASYRVNDGAGPWQSLWQHTITQGQMRGIPELFPYLCMETGYESTGLDIDYIFIGQFNSQVNGTPDAPNPYEAEVCVEGTGIIDVSVQVPGGAVYPLVYEDDEWYLEQSFATVGDMTTAFGTGDYIFTFNGGADTVTLNYDVAEPSGCPSILYPAHLQPDVEEEPTFLWTSATGLGHALGMWVIQDPDGLDFDVYGDWDVDINQASWQPGPLALDEDYEFELSVINFHDGASQAATVGGDSFAYNGVFEYINIIEFTTAAGPVLDIEGIFISQFKNYWDGSPFTDPYGIEISVEGTGLTQVSVEDPYGVVHSLVQDGPDEEWDFEDYGYADLAALQAVYGPGEYIFTFNGGADSVTLAYAAGEPGAFAPITYPSDAQTGVGLNPLYEWSSVDGLGDALAMWVVRDPDGFGEDVYEAYQPDTSQTSWQPGPLGANEEHELELSVMNFSAGTPVGTATVGGDPFGYTGAFEYINAVRFTTGAGGPAPDIEEIFINQIKHHVDGAEVPPDPCIVDISVAGAGITDVSVRVPNTDIHTLVYDPLADRWRHDESFASVAAMLAAYGTGDYLFTLNGGADTVTLNFAAAEPGGFAVITYPDHSQNDVEQHPTFTWNSMAGQGSFLNMWVTMDPGGLGFGLYGNWGADIEEVSWRPGPLPTDQNYEFGLAVANGGAQAATTNGGDPFTYSGTLEYINSIEFHASPPAPMPDIEEIFIGTFRDYVDGVEELIPYESEIEVFGSNITGVSVEVPNGGVHTLINDGGGEWWGLEEEFASLAALRAAFGTGDYIFTLNGGADTVTVPYSATAPTGFANITGPEHGNHGVELNPTFTWGSAVGSGDFLGMFVIEDPDGTDDDIYEAVPVDIGTISWQPGPLSDQTEYEFELAVANGRLDATTTDQGDAFARTTVFAYINVISFDTLHWRVAGDANDDCVVNILDMILVRNKLNDDPGSGDLWWVDVTEDGFINILDMIYIRNRLNDTCNGD